MKSIFDEEEKKLIEQNLLENFEFKSTDQHPPQASKSNLAKSFANLFSKMSLRQQNRKDAEDLKRSDTQATAHAKHATHQNQLKDVSSVQSNVNLISSIMNRELPELETIIVPKRVQKTSASRKRLEEGQNPETEHLRQQVLSRILEQNDWRDLKKSTADCELQCSRLVSNYANRSMFNPVSPLETDPKEPADRQKTSP